MADTLLLLPGNMCDARLWTPLVAALGPAGGRIAIGDLGQDATIEAMAARMLADHPGRLIPIGFSMGAIVALAMAARAPDRIAGLGLLALNASADLPERAAVRPRQQAEVKAGGLARIVADELKPNYLAAAHRGDAELLALLMAMAIDLGAHVFVRQSEALRTRGDLRPALPGIACPALLLCGAEDRLCPPAWHEAWAAALPDARLHVIAGAGHMLPLEQPGQCAARIAAWLHDKELAPWPIATTVS